MQCHSDYSLLLNQMFTQGGSQNEWELPTNKPFNTSTILYSDRTQSNSPPKVFRLLKLELIRGNLRLKQTLVHSKVKNEKRAEEVNKQFYDHEEK